jgi:alpha-L-fucosidase 2
MVYGDPCCDKIELSENTFFSGKGSLTNNQKFASKAFYKMRQQIQQDDYEGALHTSKDFVGVKNNYGTNLPVGSLYIDYGHQKKEIEDYKP